MVKFHFDTFNPHSLGFDETFSRLESLAGAGTNYPHYNVLRRTDGGTRLEVALAGYAREDLEVWTERNVLTVSARPSETDSDREYQYKGIARRSFTKNWQLADDVEVESVDFINGMLVVDLKKDLPEKQKKKIYLGSK